MAENEGTGKKSILGLPTDDLADLTAEELTGNQTAIKMFLHYYRQLVDDNSALKNENNTFKTYVDAYGRKKENTAISTVLLAISNINVGFGVGLILNGSKGAGYSSLAAGILLIFAGIYFAARKTE